jgi:hypothetical protein
MVKQLSGVQNNSLVYSSLGSLDSAEVNTPGSQGSPLVKTSVNLDSLVMNTPANLLLGVLKKTSIRTGLENKNFLVPNR